MRTVVGDRLARCLRHLWADPGVSLLELLIVVTVALILAGFALPTTAAAIDEGRGRQAAAFVAGRLRDAKQQAVTRTAAAGLVFDFTGGRWTFRLCVDRNASGLRRADLRVNKDTCVDGPVDVAGLFPGVSVAVDGSIRGPEGDAPSSDPVRFGASDLASFSPSGGCTAGSIFIRSARGAQYAVRVAGVTGRLRVLRYDAAARTWREL
jgi:prepilin-type N-terminal cleavage/methylation domain-containing protein